MEVTKKCPYCGETIKAEAVKCRFCGEWLSEPTTEENAPADTGKDNGNETDTPAETGKENAARPDATAEEKNHAAKGENNAATGTDEDSAETIRPELSLRYLESESHTTNIPPRMPAGYSYVATNEDTAPTPPLTAPDVPPTDAPLRAEPTMYAGKQKPRRRRRSQQSGRRSVLRRSGFWLTLGLLLIAAGAGYLLWPHFAAAPQPPTELPVAADSLPAAPAAVPDTLPSAAAEDSLRMQDSIARAARLRYLQTRKRAEQAEAEAAAAQAAPQADTPPTSTPQSPTPSPNYAHPSAPAAPADTAR